MSDPSATPRSPRLHGLDPAALTGVLSGAHSAQPQVPGWEISDPLGEGGLGTVWKARRISDDTVAAIKVPRAEDIALVERLEVEAAALRALDHPQIVKLLESGPLDDGSLYLAMEYVDGPPLSQAIPAAGFSPARAYELFRQIAAAVAHAHSRGVLHRDLKPGNILLDAPGNARVADFGLAHSVPDRVQRLSLTYTGLIAGTAEYLPPEAYRAGYEPAATTDIYALGVIRFELLTGGPPRGAWSPVSLQRCEVDIRIDDLLHRALDPGPARRFQSVEAMLVNMNRILNSPGRYAGTPRVTRAVRFMDFIWTALGLFLFFGALGLVVRIEKYGFGLPVDLIGTNTIRIGSYQAIIILLTVAAPFGLWQLIPLWRFPSVPLREALPAPFGLKLGTTRTTGVIVLLSQLLFLIAPGVLGALAWRETCTAWLKEGVPSWKQGLVVTEGQQGKVAHDPWQWPEEGKEYSLREHAGWITDPFRRQLDHTNYIPGLIPRLIAGLTIFYAATLTLTIMSAFARWWRFRKWGRALVLTTLLGFTAREVQAAVRRYDPNAAWAATPYERHRFSFGKHTEKLDPVRDFLFPQDGPPLWVVPPSEILNCYAATVVCDTRTLTGPDLGQYLVSHAAQRRAAHRCALRLDTVREPGHDDFEWSVFRYQAAFEEGDDPPNGPAAGHLTRLALFGSLSPAGVSIASQQIHTVQLWSVAPRVLSLAEAAEWARAFFSALGTPPATGQPDPLAALFLPRQLAFDGSFVYGKILTRETLLAHLRTGGAPLVLTRSPGPATEHPGARRRIVMEATDQTTGDSLTWTADLVHHDGRWQCVKLTW